jgi:hypothetical protein
MSTIMTTRGSSAKPRAKPSADQAARKQQAIQLETIHRRIIQQLQEGAGPGIGTLSPIGYYLFIGNERNAADIETLVENGITAVLSCMDENLSAETLREYRKRRIAQQFFPMLDHGNFDITRFFVDTADIIHKWIREERKVLVHCQQGISRSVTIVAHYQLARIYRIVGYQEGYQNRANVSRLVDPGHYFLECVIQYIRDHRPCARPNSGFLQQLLIVEQELKSRHQHMLMERASQALAERRAEATEAGEEADLYDPEERLTFAQALELVFGPEAPPPVLNGHGKKVSPTARLTTLRCDPISDIATLLKAGEADMSPSEDPNAEENLLTSE